GVGTGFTTGFKFYQKDLESNKSSNLDFFAKAIYELNLPVHISPSITWFVPNILKVRIPDETEKTVVSALMFDINGHYVFKSLDRFDFFGLTGLDITFAKKKYVSDSGGEKYKIIHNDNTIGLNLGLGTYIKVTEQIDLCIEAKYLVSKYDQFMINVGALVNLKQINKD
ncbi:MAG TPA: hypothetical protein PLQ61_10385, partial [Bacteroidales bacterium]|nr:hypothetical protein [Bacteroidales bacterium]